MNPEMCATSMNPAVVQRTHAPRGDHRDRRTLAFPLRCIVLFLVLGGLPASGLSSPSRSAARRPETHGADAPGPEARETARELDGGSAPGGTAASGVLTRFTYTQYHMGVDARLVIYAPDQPAAEDAGAAAFARIAALDSIMSDYRRDSELMRFCARAGGPPVPVSPDLFAVLRRAREVAQKSGGAFDVSVGPLVALWRQARKTGVRPDAAAIERARRLVGWQKLRLDPDARTARLTLRGMQLDLGGIAKGYAADAAQRVLKQRGVTRALVELGGDLVVSGPPPGTDGWTIRVPNAGTDQGPVDLRFNDRGISSSGDTEQSVVIGGRRYSHVIDPRTGQALTNRVQVTVIAPDGLTSDPLSTALTVMGNSARDRSQLLQAYPATTAYVRVLPAE
jgi:thiamine biosynthesis lipoprotein